MTHSRRFTMRSTQFAFAILFLLLATVTRAADTVEPVYTPWYSDAAIKGYDVVAYFTEDRPVKGSKEFAFRWRDADWYFANARHRDLFMADPEKYAPQYGGFCAYGVVEGHAVAVDPEQFTIHEGKLYLNFSASVNRKWRQNMQEYINAADRKWPAMVQQW